MQLFLLKDIYWNIILLRRYQAKHRIAPWLGGWHKLQAHHYLGICICRGRPYSSSLNLSNSNIVLIILLTATIPSLPLIPPPTSSSSHLSGRKSLPLSPYPLFLPVGTHLKTSFALNKNFHFLFQKKCGNK